MNNADRLAALTQVATLRLRAMQSEMAVLLSQETDLRNSLRRLTEEKQQSAIADRGADDPARIANADLRWHRWVDQRKAVINASLAQVLAKKMECRIKLKKAFGQNQATEALAQRATRAAQRVRARSADYES